MPTQYGSQIVGVSGHCSVSPRSLWTDAWEKAAVLGRECDRDCARVLALSYILTITSSLASLALSYLFPLIPLGTGPFLFFSLTALPAPSTTPPTTSMSIPTISPTTPTPDKQLEPLQDLKIKGFGSCQDTPSSKTASLPTPGGVPVPLANSADLMDASLGDNDDDEWPLIAPGAPLLKDLDSFTEGTGAGSFDSIPAAETDERGNPIYRLSEARLSLVSEPRDKDAYVLQWLRTLPTSHAQAPSTSLFSFYDLLESAPTLKRPRSMTEYDEYRPRRPRTRSCPSSRRSNSMAPD